MADEIERTISRFAVVASSVVLTVIDLYDDSVETYAYPNPDAVLVPDPDSMAEVGSTWDGENFFRHVAPAKPRTEMAADVDSAIAAIYAPKMILAEEYKVREAEARAYKAAEIAETALPAAPRVQGYANAEGLSLANAVTSTISQADALRGALASLSDLRMLKRAFVRKVDDVYVLTDEQAATLYHQTMATIQAIGIAIA